MKPLLNAMLNCVTLNIPVGICTAVKRNEMTFRQLHKECGTPLSQIKKCHVCEREIETYEIVKGFEYAKNTFVVVDDTAMTELGAGERSKVIAIRKFAPRSMVDALMIDKSYLLSPASVLTRPYVLLSNALGNDALMGIGSSSLWGKEYPCAIWPKENGTLVMSLLYCHDEVADDSEIAEKITLVPADEQQLANEIVGVLTRDIDPLVDFASESRRRIQEYVAAEVGGVSYEIPKAAPDLAVTTDIMGALRESVELARQLA